MRILLTGGSGFLGQHAVVALAETGNDIVATYVHEPGCEAPNVRWVRCDLLDGRAMRALVRRARASRLLHMAWRPIHGNVNTAHDNADWLRASLDLAHAFADAGGQRIVGAGSCMEYDWPDGARCSEAHTPIAPNTFYGECKHALHQGLGYLAQDAGLSLAWARIFHAYGPGEHESRFVASVANALLRGEPAEMTCGTQVRDYAFAGDLGEALAQLTMSDCDGVYNVASGAPTALRDIACEIARQIGRPDLIRLGGRAARPYEPKTIVADLNKTAAELGWRARTPLSRGIAETIATMRGAA
jgi:nucleoside-diphosphate-sugar epimerase